MNKSPIARIISRLRTPCWRYIVLSLLTLSSVLVSQTSLADENFSTNVIAATDAYIDTLTTEDRDQADAYYEGGHWLFIVNLIWLTSFNVLFMALGLSKRVQDIATGKFNNVFMQRFSYFGLYLICCALVVLIPFSLYADFWREHHYGFSNQSLGEWFSFVLTSLALNFVIGGLIINLLYLCLSKLKAPWLWFTSIAVILTFVLSAIGPTIHSAIIEKSQPLEAGTIKTLILDMAKQQQIPVDEVYVTKTSERSNKILAYVAGLLGTERITVNDNLLNRCSEDEILAVMGHEMAHYQLNHTLTGAFISSFMFLLFFIFMGWGTEKTLARWGNRWGITRQEEIGSLPIIVVMISIVMLVSSPLQINVTRYFETQADAMGLEIAQRPEAFSTVVLKLGEFRKLEPDALEEFLFFEHPSGRQRILRSMQWREQHGGLSTIQHGDSQAPKTSE